MPPLRYTSCLRQEAKVGVQWISLQAYSALPSPTYKLTSLQQSPILAYPNETAMFVLHCYVLSTI